MNTVAGYRHPGREFVDQFGPAESVQDFGRYANFLREKAGLAVSDAVDLEAIYHAFGIPSPKRVSLPGQQGMLLNPDSGLILINQDDIAARQRFTEAHELMELLVDALPAGLGLFSGQKGPFRHTTKEQLCNQAAANLLMPVPVFSAAGLEGQVGFGLARKLSRRYDVSTTAALVQLVRVVPGQLAIVAWRMKFKKADRSQQVPPEQMLLFKDLGPLGPAKKLRVDWSISAPDGPFVPKNKSADQSSSIYEAWNQSQFTAAIEQLDLGSRQAHCRLENLPFRDDGEALVLSLIEIIQ
jgi:hypothetical protein